jgi:hypothetical protein
LDLNENRFAAYSIAYNPDEAEKDPQYYPLAPAYAEML